IFGKAYDDEAVEEVVDMNNVVSSYTIPDAPLTKFLKDPPKDHSPVTILNTKDYLGKFDEKADEGFFCRILCGTKDNIVAGQAKKKNEPEQDCKLIPICKIDPLISQGPKDSVVDAGKKATKVDASQFSNNGGQNTRSDFEGLIQRERQTGHINSTNSFNTICSPVSTAGPSFVNTASPSPINAAETPASTNAFKKHPFE
nr:hypothetical protein [Tanacetum cinerariifolium]